LWGTANEVPALVKALDDQDIFTRQEALRQIGKFRDERSLKAVIRCFTNLQTSAEAEKTLLQMGPMAEKEVLALLTDGPANLRHSEINILRGIGTQKSVPALQAVAATEWTLKPQAEMALKAITARGN
jgi:HEAT repeat protein